MDSDQTVSAIRQVLAQHARLPVDPTSLELDDDLFEAGMSSHASVNVMLALEDSFDIEFPDAMLTRSAFASIGAIADGVGRLQGEPAAG
jgi:acyl carrier protein